MATQRQLWQGNKAAEVPSSIPGGQPMTKASAMTIDGPQVDDKNPTPATQLYNPNGGRIPSAVTPYQNPNLQASLSRQLAKSKEFRANIPQMSDKLYADYSTGARQNLAANLKDVDKDFNRRGLLKSGMRTGAQYGAQAANTNDLATARAKINSGLLDRAEQMDTGVYNTAGNIANTGYSMTEPMIYGEQTRLNRMADDAAADQALWSSIMGTAGGVAGTYTGTNSKQKPGSASNSPQNYGATY